MGVRAWIVTYLAAIALTATCPVARADSWALPEVTTYEAPGKQYRLTVTPRSLESQLDYFTDAVADKEKPGQLEGEADQAWGLLERREASGAWSRVWEAPLINDVAPVSAIVSDAGEVATFDNWHSMGWGKNAVALYDTHGKLLRAMALTDFLPEDWFLTLPRSVSSIWWSGKHRFESGTLILQVVRPETGRRTADAEVVEIAIDPASGRTTPRDPAAWDSALKAAAAAAIPIHKARAEYLAMLRAPLAMPDGVSDKRTLHWYLGEAYRRLDPDWKTGSPDTWVLDRPGSKGYDASVKWLDGALGRKPIHQALALASYDPGNLADVIVAAAAKQNPGPLRGYRVYATITDADRDRVAAAIERLGATFVQIDPAEPIPPRPDRPVDLDAF